MEHDIFKSIVDPQVLNQLLTKELLNSYALYSINTNTNSTFCLYFVKNILI